MVTLSKRFGEHLRKSRTKRGLNQAALGDAAGVSEEWVRRIERGVTSPSFETIEALAAALGVEAVVPLAPPTDSDFEERLLAAAKSLDPDERDWLVSIVVKLCRHPKS